MKSIILPVAFLLALPTAAVAETFSQIGPCSAALVGGQAVINCAAPLPVPPPPPPPPVVNLAPPVTNQGNYATGCSGASCLTFEDHWTSATLDTTKWYPGLYINNQYINGGTNFAEGFPYSAWTICNCNGGTGTVFLGYPYGYATNTIGSSLNFDPLKKAADGSLQMTAATNSFFASSHPMATHIGSSISSNYGNSTIIPATGGIMQYRAKFDDSLTKGSYPMMQCSSSTPGVSGTSYNANHEFGYNWVGTPLTNVGMSVNNVPANTSNGGTSSTAVAQVPTNNNLTNWHSFAIEYTGDGTNKKWQYYVDGVMVNSATATHPAGTKFNCSWQINNTVPVNSGWHTVATPTYNGPYTMWLSDVQFYKKPGT